MKKFNVLVMALVLLPTCVQAAQVKETQNTKLYKIKKYTKIGLKGSLGFLLGQCALNLLRTASVFSYSSKSGIDGYYDPKVPLPFLNRWINSVRFLFGKMIIIPYQSTIILKKFNSSISGIIPMSNRKQAHLIASIILAFAFGYGTYRCFASVAKDIREASKEEPKEAIA